MKKSATGIKSDANSFIADNITEDISAGDVRQRIIDTADSFLNIADGGMVVDALTGYSSDLTPTNDKHFAPKKYVDSLKENEAEVTTDINWSISHHYHTLTGNKTFTFSNVGERKTIIVAVEQEIGEDYTADWPTVNWGSGGVPVQSEGGAGGATDIYTFVEINGIVYGSVRQ
jgi:hypothetical protein